MMSKLSHTPKKRLTQEELVEAFNKYMPKKPVYPRLAVFEDEKLDNSSTDSEGSGDEEETVNRLKVNMKITTNISPECVQSYRNKNVKPPADYLKDNIQEELERALDKLVNLKVKPKNPIEWLGYCLLNMNINQPNPRTNDHETGPTRGFMKCKVYIGFDPEVVPIPVIVPNPMYQGPSNKVTAPPPAKRRHPEN